MYMTYCSGAGEDARCYDVTATTEDGLRAAVCLLGWSVLETAGDMRPAERASIARLERQAELTLEGICTDGEGFGWYVVQPAWPGVRGSLNFELDAALRATAWTDGLLPSERFPLQLLDHWWGTWEPTLVAEHREGERRVRVVGHLSMLRRLHRVPLPAPVPTLKRLLDLCQSLEFSLHGQPSTPAHRGSRSAISRVYDRLLPLVPTRYTYERGRGGLPFGAFQREALARLVAALEEESGAEDETTPIDAARRVMFLRLRGRLREVELL